MEPETQPQLLWSSGRKPLRIAAHHPCAGMLGQLRPATYGCQRRRRGHHHGLSLHISRWENNLFGIGTERRGGVLRATFRDNDGAERFTVEAAYIVFPENRSDQSAIVGGFFPHTPTTTSTPGCLRSTQPANASARCCGTMMQSKASSCISAFCPAPSNDSVAED